MIKKTTYSILELLYGNKGIARIINGIKVKLPVKYFRYFPSDYEADNFQFLKQTCKPGAVVIDIGAHIGLFALAAANSVTDTGKVFAFEPTPATNALLKKTIGLNKLGKVIFPRNEAVGKEVGKTRFFISDTEGDNSNSLVSYKEDRVLHGVEINVVSVDAFVEQQQLQKVDFLKIDAEGVEQDVLAGAVKTMEKFRPVCILSIHPEPIAAKGDKLEDIYGLVKKLNYKIVYNEEEVSKEFFCINKQLLDFHLLPL